MSCIEGIVGFMDHRGRFGTSDTSIIDVSVKDQTAVEQALVQSKPYNCIPELRRPKLRPFEFKSKSIDLFHFNAEAMQLFFWLCNRYRSDDGRNYACLNWHSTPPITFSFD
ncbi:hypothetical protein R3P38DRAFT_3183453 [Favolaschia claudopus]|uniref:Uncharacterized protein n=1 Tax=Favolaschia claudopus TaxID=2862362 RepID=A0AAW0C8B0_9AGAR